jgi:DNA-binding transcriptional LysR family regulator
MTTFVAVAEAKGFRAAGERLGVSHSAVSQALRRLEERLGVALVRRSTRSVHLTDAGERLYASLRPALDEVRAAVAAVGELGDAPRGTLRLHTSSIAETMIGESLLTNFLRDHPHVQLDLVVSDAPVDIVADGYDAGLQLGEVIDKDMIAVPVTDDLRLAVVGAPAYFARRGTPKHPRELVDHECLNWHPTATTPPYRWEFSENGRTFAVAVRARPVHPFGAEPPLGGCRPRPHDGLRGARARVPGARRACPGARQVLRAVSRVLPLLPAATACVTSAAGVRRSRAWCATRRAHERPSRRICLCT